MTTWKYVGCSLSDLPSEITDNHDKLTREDIKYIIDSVTIIEGEIEAVTVDAITALLIGDGIFPLKIHPDDGNDDTIDKLKRFKSKILKNEQNKKD